MEAEVKAYDRNVSIALNKGDSLASKLKEILGGVSIDWDGTQNSSVTISILSDREDVKKGDDIIQALADLLGSAVAPAECTMQVSTCVKTLMDLSKMTDKEIADITKNSEVTDFRPKK